MSEKIHLKEDIGMSPHEKKGNKRMPTPKQKLIHNPIPTSLLLFKVSIVLAVSSSTNNRYISEGNKDVGMGL